MTDYREFQTFTEYGIFDADQHMYEPHDCYLEYIEDRFRADTLQGATVDGRAVVAGGGGYVPVDNAGSTCVRPGSLKEMLKRMKSGSGATGDYHEIPMDPAFVDRDLRVAQMDRQNVDAAFVFSGAMGLFAEYLLTDDDLYWASSWAYLRWLEDHWGLGTDGRIITAPTISLRDVAKAGEQLDWLFERGARAVSMLPGPAYGRSPADKHFDPVWARIEEAGAVVCFHINEAIHGYKASRSEMWGEEQNPSFYTQSAWQWLWAYGETPSLETYSSLVYGNLFGRFPGLRVVSAEVGAEWIPSLIRRMDKMRGMGRNGPWIGGQLTERPSEIFMRHFRVVPYWEDDLAPVIAAVGRDTVIGGSDFPHSEGLAFPTQLVEHLDAVAPEDQRWIMRDNAMTMLGLS